MSSIHIDRIRDGSLNALKTLEPKVFEHPRHDNYNTRVTFNNSDGTNNESFPAIDNAVIDSSSLMSINSIFLSIETNLLRSY